MSTSQKIKNVVIVGGGTAGWIAATVLLDRLSPRIKLTLVEPKDIPIIGVGESTTGRFTDLILKCLHLQDENEFLRETGSTFKYGTYHTNWTKMGRPFCSPFGGNFPNNHGGPHADYDYVRMYHIAENIPFNYTLQSQLMLNHKAHILKNGEPLTKDSFVDRGYHLDTYRVGDYLRRKALGTKRIKRIEDKVTKVNLTEDGSIDSLLLSGGKIIDGDLFIDCTGFKRVLINELDSGWVSYDEHLLVNRALPFYSDYKDENDPIKTYTHVWAQKYGWLWEIPLQERVGCGYVYNDTFTTPEKAQEEIETVLGHKIEPKGDIKFNSGRLKKFWNKNVLSTGLSSAFIEPIEATSIHNTILQLTYFTENYFHDGLDMSSVEDLQSSYNEQMVWMWDDIADFLTFHYISDRDDTEFWKEASSPERWSDDLKLKLRKWKTRMPRVIDYLEARIPYFYNLGDGLWYHMAFGMGLLDSKLAKHELDYYGLYEKAKSHFKSIQKFSGESVLNAATTNQFFREMI